MNNLNIVAIIPARSGSKGIPNKNIRELNEQPLISYSILDAIRTVSIDEVFVTTDSTLIADISLTYGAVVPFLRPKELALSNSTDFGWANHFIRWFKEQYDYYPEYLVLLRTTTPIREISIIEKAIECIKKEPEATSLRSVQEFSESPYKWFKFNGEKYLYPLLGDDFDLCNRPRQEVPIAYKPNGYVDILKSSTILDGDVYGKKILGFKTPYSVEIDVEEDFILAEALMKRKEEGY